MRSAASSEPPAARWIPVGCPRTAKWGRRAKQSVRRYISPAEFPEPIQHLVGMQDSEIVIAINRDKDAPIFEVATYGIVGDVFQIIPAITRRLQELRQRKDKSEV